LEGSRGGGLFYFGERGLVYKGGRWQDHAGQKWVMMGKDIIGVYDRVMIEEFSCISSGEC
jgi:hypothetical protein